MELNAPFTRESSLVKILTVDGLAHAAGEKASSIQEQGVGETGYDSERLYEMLPLAFEQSKTYSLPLPRTAIDEHLEQDLDLSRFNQFSRLIGLAGPSRPARSLHQQRMMDRQIIAAEQMDLHLVWFEKTIFVKPIPRILLCQWAWKQCGLCDPGQPELRKSACGLLLSYTWLIRHESDLKIAVELGLLPDGVTWASWRRFAYDFLDNVNSATLEHVHPRYRYGELRLGRLNWISRVPGNNLSLMQYYRGYSYGYNRRDAFLHRNFAWLAAGSVYVGIVLTAMQVGLATDKLSQNQSFQNASYGFTIFSILLPLGFGVIALVFALSVLALPAFGRTSSIGKRLKRRLDGHTADQGIEKQMNETMERVPTSS